MSCKRSPSTVLEDWGSKACLFSASLLPFFDAGTGSLKNLEDPNMGSTFCQLVATDGHHEFNRCLLHGILFGLWIEVKKLSPALGFVPLFRCTLTTCEYVFMVQKFNFHKDLRETLWWIPKLEHLWPPVCEHLWSEGNGIADGHIDGSNALEVTLLNQQQNAQFPESVQNKKNRELLAEMIDERLAAFIDGMWNPSTALERLLSICLWRMMPEHPCQVQKSEPNGAFHLTCTAPPWSVPHLVMQLLTFLHSCVSEVRVSSISTLLDALMVTLRVIMSIEDSFDQHLVMKSVISCSSYYDLVSRLCLNEALYSICSKGLIPPLNKVMELGEIANGAIMDEEEEDKRLASMSSWFLPFLILFPTIALKHIIQSAITNRGQFDILSKLMIKWKPLLHSRNPLGLDSPSTLITSIQLVIMDSGDILKSDIAASLFSEVIFKASKSWGASLQEVVRDIIIRFLNKYKCGEDVPIESVLLAAGLIYQGIGQSPHGSVNPVELLHYEIDLIDLICHILTGRPQTVQWSCAFPEFVPMKIIELCDNILSTLVQDLPSIGACESIKVWDSLLENSRKFTWPVQVKLLSVLDGLKQKGSLARVGRISPPASFEGDFCTEKDPYSWAKIVEDVFTGLGSCKGLIEMILESYSNESLDTYTGSTDNLGFIGQRAAFLLRKCPNHLFPWCAVVSIARILPFMTSRECAMLCTDSLAGILTCCCPNIDHASWSAAFQVQTHGLQHACLIIELVCRSIYFLAAHEDVIVVDRQVAVFCALRRLNEIGESLLNSIEGDAAALELASGRWFKDICGLLAAIQGHYPCDVLQPLLLLFLHTLMKCYPDPDPTTKRRSRPVRSKGGVPLQVLIEWLCSLTKPLPSSLRNTLESAMDRLVERKLKPPATDLPSRQTLLM